MNYSTPQKRTLSWNGDLEQAHEDQSRKTWLSSEIESRQLEARGRAVAALKKVQIAFIGTC